MTIDPNVNFAVLPNAQAPTEFAATLHDAVSSCSATCRWSRRAFRASRPATAPCSRRCRTARSRRPRAQTWRGHPFARGDEQSHGIARHRRPARDDRRPGRAAEGDVLHRFENNRQLGGRRHLRSRCAGRPPPATSSSTTSAGRRHPRQLQALVAAAEEKGVAVGIGHMYPSTIRVLPRTRPRFAGRASDSCGRARSWNECLVPSAESRVAQNSALGTRYSALNFASLLLALFLATSPPVSTSSFRSSAAATRA